MALEIFKLCHLKNNKIEKIDVFNGNTLYPQQNILEIYSANKTVFDGIFDAVELKNIEDNAIPVFFHPTFIHIDDTIETIKKKLIGLYEVSFEELYLFYSYLDILTPYAIYEHLTQDKKIPLTKTIMLQFLLNIDEEKILERLPDKEDYSYNDILELGLSDKTVLINRALGQVISVRDGTSYPFLVNPFNTLVFDSTLVNAAQDYIKTTNRTLLMTNFINQNKIHNNTIYICTAENTMNYIQELGLSVSDCIKLYFPYLLKLDITSLDQFMKRKSALVSKSREMINPEFERNNDNINLFYQIFAKKTSELKYVQKGISKMEFTLKPNNYLQSTIRYCF